ncbi:hypothetical protein [Candidatus Methylobacter oryzae]|uniref:DUF2357 domain-containing protein n=1 Tax=Candidatus Methylobacter oryzae TaxID=2497749 RepID=A0ABY3C4S1_9GAMM|nr:hypothetical protein [Candidatus Methylobacter oryzae]TRW89536.1 hypothetical protein EKO24_020960 [Candidatus Methylobacter oryzae]
MFNFKELKLDRRENSDNSNSFVGIRRSNDELEFRLPKGFENFPDNDFDATKRLFFRMYRTFKKFEKDNLLLSLDEKPAGKDNIETKANAYLFKDKEDNEVLLYSKISVIENLLDAYQDLALDLIQRRIGLDEKIDYSKIDQYLHNAIYLPNDVIYLDEMHLPRQTLHYDSATLVDLFCFILYELESELEQDSDERVRDLANRLKEQHLSHDQSLFNEETFETTITILKDILDDIDKITAYKDEDYWQLYDAIESFLYGELDMQNTHDNGIFWGISNFYQIWEDMCHSYAFANFDITYADTNIVFEGKRVANDTSTGFSIFKRQGFENPFFLQFRDQKRWIRPDLVHSVLGNNDITIIFNNIIDIIVIKDHGLTLDFEVKLVDKQKESIYTYFCSRLRKNLGGARATAKNIFYHYRKPELEKQKNAIEERYRRLYEPLEKYNQLHIFLDWKYRDIEYFLSSRKRVERDITKQLCYELALHQYIPNSIIQSQFIIPYFYNGSDEDIGEFVDDEVLYRRIRDNGIRVFQANFSKIQEVYLNHD